MICVVSLFASLMVLILLANLSLLVSMFFSFNRLNVFLLFNLVLFITIILFPAYAGVISRMVCGANG